MNSLMQQSLNTFEAEEEWKKRDFINLQKTVAEKIYEVITNVPYDGNSFFHATRLQLGKSDTSLRNDIVQFF